jgi:hypothetical protein
MPTPSEIERAIVLQLLSDEHHMRWSHDELTGALAHLPASDLSEAILRLDADGVLERRGERIWASRPTRRLDELALIAV